MSRPFLYRLVSGTRRLVDQFEPEATFGLEGEDTLEIAAPLEGTLELERDLEAGEPLEVGRLAQRTIETGRRDFQTAVVVVLDHQDVGELMADALAVLHADALGRIDVDAQQSARRKFDLDHLVVERRDGFLNDVLNGCQPCRPLLMRPAATACAKKNGLRQPISFEHA